MSTPLSDPQRAHGVHATTAETIDAGLRQHMWGIYNYMFAALALSGGVAFALGATGLGAIFFAAGQLTPLGWGAVFAPLGLLLVASFTARRLSTGATRAIYCRADACVGRELPQDGGARWHAAGRSVVRDHHPQHRRLARLLRLARRAAAS